MAEEPAVHSIKKLTFTMSTVQQAAEQKFPLIDAGGRHLLRRLILIADSSSPFFPLAFLNIELNVALA